MNKIFLILLSVFLLIIVPWRMLVIVYDEMTPSGKYENYKEYISESAEKWVKNRDNGYYDKEQIINWYESDDENGKRPMDLFPDVIDESIREAIYLTFEKFRYVEDPDTMKNIIMKNFESKKEYIIKRLESEI
tara:strand:- start:17 stop:415 length:399 start_codon:yes stop_codon:yes gene_type:complete